MFEGSATAERFFQFVWNIRSDKYTFTVSHNDDKSPLDNEKPERMGPLQDEARRISRILSPLLQAEAIIHLGRPLPAGSSSLPGNTALSGIERAVR